MKTNYRFILAGLAALLIVGFQNCSGENFSPTPNQANGVNGTDGGGGGTTSGTSPCTPQQATNLRIVFMVDDSGSTYSDDSGATVRGTSALDFLNQNSAATNLTYSYNFFTLSTTASNWDFSNSTFTSNPKTSFGNAAQAITAVNNFVSTYDSYKSGSTSYTDAFATLDSIVTADEAANPGYSYAVIFMSDGQPDSGATSVSAVEGLVTTLLKDGGAGRITVSSLYFNDASNADAQEASLMQDIATTGLGQYVNVVTGQGTLNLTDMVQNIITVPGMACQ